MGRQGFEYGVDGPKTIVTGVDGSDSSWRAVAYAAGLARRQGALLVLVYVQPVVTASAAGVGGTLLEVGQQVAEDLLQHIRQAVKRFGDHRSIRWEFHTFPGDPYTGLLTTADELRADAVVVGASEQAGHRIVGSVAVRLVKAGRWPVTVVP
ncbi:universal stress protein [Peterkaempfera bronchialis]|uniref:Universal stress protein n=1 Tax=Peterkaempfera bronchialis TaxID=2126346 RepID=A0A345SZE5_9ACTN|nr:universal stress protein [Peterkaempfera bronchialis]